ncbi:MAG: hypothetical protein NVS9B1_19590 [Candidatus Dormibacteraceae bacterium]
MGIKIGLRIAGALLALAVGVPVVAFGIIPLFVHSTVHEAPPTVAVAAPAIGPAPAAGSAEPAPSPSPAGPLLYAAGSLKRVDAVHFGSGRVTIQSLGARRFLRFEDVAIAGAPNMYVYLSNGNDGRPGTFVDLGPLRATNGSFNYELPPDLDLGPIHSVVVWCRAFSVTVTWADLSPV